MTRARRSSPAPPTSSPRHSLSGEPLIDESYGSSPPLPPPPLPSSISMGETTPRVGLSRSFPGGFHAPPSARAVAAGGSPPLAGGTAGGADALTASATGGADAWAPPDVTMSTASHERRRISSWSNKRARDDTVHTERNTMQDAGCQTDDRFPEVEAIDQSGATGEVIPFQMPYPMSYQMPEPWWLLSCPMFSLPHPMYPPPQVSRPMMQFPFGEFSWPFDFQMGRSQFSSTVVSPMGHSQRFSLPVVQGLGSAVTMPSPAVFSQSLGLGTSPAVFSHSMGLGTSPAVFSHSMGLGPEHGLIGGTLLPGEISSGQAVRSSIPSRPNVAELPPRPRCSSRPMEPPPPGREPLPTWSSSRPDLVTPLPRPTPNAVEPRPWTGSRQISPPRGSTIPDRWMVGSSASNVPSPTRSSSRPDLVTALPRPTPNAVEPRPWTGSRQISPPRGSTIPDRWMVGSSASNVPSPPTRKRSPPPRCPPYPKGHDLKALKEWNQECRKVSILAAEDPLYNLPFLEQNNFPLLEKPKDIVSKSDKAVVQKVARSLVSVSSVDQDGVVVLQCTGVIIGTFKENGPAIILTTSDVICDDSGNLHSHKVLVRFPDNKEFDGNILFFDAYYQIAFLGISAGRLLVGPSFGSTLGFGDEVFVISRNGNSSLMAKKGEVLWFETSYLGRNFYKYLSCELPKCCVSGPVVDKNGNISGMAFIVGIPSPAIIPSSIIVKCIEMYKKFGRIARPEHGISLRTLESLDVTAKEGITVAHKIENGYIVDEVLVESDAERFDIRLGDIIVSFDGMNSQSLLVLELYLLSIGCEFLEKNLDSNSKVIFKLQVYDPLGHCHRTIRLPVGFSSSPADTS